MTNQTKVFKRYTEQFKLHVVSLVLGGEFSKSEIAKKYGIPFSMTVHRWCLKYGGDFYRKGLYNDLPLDLQSKEVIMSRKKPEPVPDDLKLLKQRIAELEVQLAASELKREALERFFAIAKRDYGIDTLKKPDTKQSPK
jgi:transposase-like protein